MSFSPGGIDYDSVMATLHQWVVNGSGLPATSVYWGQQRDAPRPPEPAIEMKLADLKEIGLPWLDIVNSQFTFTALTVSAVSTVTSQLTITAHGLKTGDGPIQLQSTLTVPSPLIADTDYWVIAIDANHIQLADSYAHTGGTVYSPPTGNTVTPITLLSMGSGTITLSSTGNTVRAGQEMRYLSRVVLRPTLTLTCYTSIGVGINMAAAILRRIGSRRVLPSQMDLLQAANIGVEDMERVRSIHGVTDALLFEPRAMVEIYLNLASEEEEDGTIITSASGTNDITSQSFKIP